MTRNLLTSLLLLILILCCLYKGISAADENNGFIVSFDSESSLQDIQKEVSEAKQTLTDAVTSSDSLDKDYASFVKRVAKLEDALSMQNGKFLSEITTFIDKSIAIQRTEWSQQLMAEEDWLKEKMNAQLTAFITELQMSEIA